MKIHTQNAVIETDSISEALELLRAINKKNDIKATKVEVVQKVRRKNGKIVKRTKAFWNQDENNFILKNYDRKNHNASLKLLMRSKELMRHTPIAVQTRVYEIRGKKQFLNA